MHPRVGLVIAGDVQLPYTMMSAYCYTQSVLRLPCQQFTRSYVVTEKNHPFHKIQGPTMYLELAG